MLIHAGRGMPPIGAHLAAVAQRHPGAILILAHAAIVDQERIADLTAGHANVFFDTSTWSVFDILALLARVAPEQVLFATDVPYGNHLSALTLIAAVLEQVGASEAIRRGVMGETLEGILRGELPDALGAARAARSSSCRRSTCAWRATCRRRSRMLWLRQRDVIGMLGLAAGVCEGDSGARAAARADRRRPASSGTPRRWTATAAGARASAAARGAAAAAARARPRRHAARAGAPARMRLTSR